LIFYIGCRIKILGLISEKMVGLMNGYGRESYARAQ
jgi:hypothetical protein